MYIRRLSEANSKEPHVVSSAVRFAWLDDYNPAKMLGIKPHTTQYDTLRRLLDESIDPSTSKPINREWRKAVNEFQNEFLKGFRKLNALKNVDWAKEWEKTKTKVAVIGTKVTAKAAVGTAKSTWGLLKLLGKGAKEGYKAHKKFKNSGGYDRLKEEFNV
jgi:hypothetical protein